MEIKNRVLELSNKDFDNILNNKGNKVLDKLEEELKKNNYILSDFSICFISSSDFNLKSFLFQNSQIISA